MNITHEIIVLRDEVKRLRKAIELLLPEASPDVQGAALGVLYGDR